MATFEEVVTLLTAKSTNVAAFGKKIKVVLEGDVLIVNGSQDPVTIDTVDAEADIVVTATLDDFYNIITKKTNAQLALMNGKLKTKGDMLALVPLIKLL